MVVLGAVVVMQVEMDRLTLLQERLQVAVDVGVPHIEGKAEVEGGQIVEEARFPEETDIPRPHVQRQP